ncbi:DUF397 domain-containing protein [Saccharothrix violaceirubra]|uniref:DUF397 domain-containing protein n=1 Tax=Saccharothrix violaceirubra TaxID=413306 RepID=UPI001621F66C|nr:DUF397 domain-containing protein [Saccharothrix violaceirubra]
MVERWRKSSHSSGNSGGCVELACGVVERVSVRAVRDSKNPAGHELLFTAAAVERVVAALKADRVGWSRLHDGGDR